MGTGPDGPRGAGNETAPTGAQRRDEMMTITRVNIYKHDGEWCFATWSGSEFDCSDPLDLPDDTTEAEATADAQRQFPGAEIRRVDDV